MHVRTPALTLQILRKPSTGMMAGLLGVAIGVMATVSLVELIVGSHGIKHSVQVHCWKDSQGRRQSYTVFKIKPGEARLLTGC